MDVTAEGGHAPGTQWVEARQERPGQSPQQRTTQPKMCIVPLLRNPALSGKKSSIKDRDFKFWTMGHYLGSSVNESEDSGGNKSNAGIVSAALPVDSPE